MGYCQFGNIPINFIMKIIFKLYFILQCSVLFSQTSFNHYNPSKYYDSDLDIDYFDSTIYLLGGSQCFDQFNCNSLVKTDLNGNVIDEFIYTDYPYKKIGFDMMIDSDSNIVMTGTRGQTLEKNTVMVYKVKLNGDSLGVNYYDDLKVNNEGGEKIIETRDSNYLIYAQRGVDNQWARQYLIKTDRNGNKLWEKRIDGDTLGKYTNYQYGRDIYELEDGDFWMAYNITSRYIGIPENEYAGIIRTDSLGNKKVNIVLDYGNYDEEISIYPYKNKGVLTTWTANDSAIYNMKLTYFDSLGNEVWKRKFLQRYTIGKINVLKNKNIIIYGLDLRELWQYIFCVDSQGNTIWTKTFPYEKSLPYIDELTKMIELPDGRIAFAGDITLPITREHDILLLILDKDGCLTPGCGDTIFLLPPVANSDLLALREFAFSFSPNPAKDNIQIHFINPLNSFRHEIQLFDIKGQKIISQPLSSGSQDITVDLSNHTIPNGTYILQYLREGQLVQAEKVAIQR